MAVARVDPSGLDSARSGSGWRRGSTPPGGSYRADAGLELLLTEDDDARGRSPRELDA